VLDGVFGPDEWRDAHEIYADEACVVLIKKSEGNIYVGVKCTTVILPMVDLFVHSEAGSTYQFHASSFLAERLVVDGELTESPWHSNLVLDWAANTLRWNKAVRDSLTAIGVRGPEMLRQAATPLDGLEYRIRLSQFSSSQWSLRFQVSDFGIDAAPLTLPPNSVLESPHDWFRIDVSNLNDRYTRTSAASE